MMQRRPGSNAADTPNLEHETGLESKVIATRHSQDMEVTDYLKLLLYCFLLIIPVYAIIRSVIDQNWLMVIIDILLIPVGFIHGILLLFGAIG